MFLNPTISKQGQQATIKQLKSSLLFILLGLFFLLFSEFAFSPFDEIEIAIVVCILVISLLYYWANMDTASIVIGLALWSLTILATYLAWRNHGLFDTAILAFPCIILLALVLGSEVLSIPLILYIQSTILFFMYAHTSGLIETKELAEHSSKVRAIDIVVLFSFFSAVTFIYIRDIKKTLTRQFNKNQKLKIQLEQTSQLVNFDPLTSLPNERICRPDILTLLANLPSSGNTLSFMTLDLHNLRSINNSLGHDVGDALLKQLSQRLMSLKKDKEHIYRFQGVEFVFLKLSSSHEEIEVFKEQIFQATSLPFYINEYEIELFVSIGISIAPFDGDNLETLRKKSHLALHQANSRNINTFHYYDESMTSTENNKYQLIQALKSALLNNELELYYQPKVNLKNNQITGAEALIRWHSAELGMVPPDIFIPVAEESGIIIDITKWLINEACNTCLHWHKQGLEHLNVAVNLSPVDFRRGNLPQIVLKALQKSGLSPHYLELEITESMIIDDVSHIQNQIRQLHSKGITFSIDDFGTGYSNLGYLNKFNVTTLKIDRSFIKNIHLSEHDFLIVKAIIKMSRSLGISNVAEGVENQEAAQLLLEQQCEYGQGYYWSKPLAHEEFIKYALGQ
jgi:diguanylate cyclase (GGDEF)-like protein